MSERIESVEKKAVIEVPSSLTSLIEALIFASDEPLTIRQIKELYDVKDDGVEPRHIEPQEIKEIVAVLNQAYEETGRPYRIIELAGGYTVATLPEYAVWLGKLYEEKAKRRLSQSALETLAIIAYKQPITKPDIEAIRGVNCDYVLKTLLEKNLSTIVGRAETVGRPLLYGTTKQFLNHFGLSQITDLPRPREVEEILGESQFETERRMMEAQAKALEAQKKEEEDFKSRLPHIPKRTPELEQKDVKIIERRKPRQLKTYKSDTPVSESTEVTAEKGSEKKAAPVSESATSEVALPVTNAESSHPELRTKSGAQAESSQGSSVASAVKSDSPNVQNSALVIPQTIAEVKHPPAEPVVPLVAIPEQPVMKSKPPSPVPVAVNNTNAPSIAEVVPSTEDHAFRQEQGKSRWQKLKEKITGLIQKLFG